jgi:hypothetical protein
MAPALERPSSASVPANRDRDPQNARRRIFERLALRLDERERENQDARQREEDGRERISRL